jgi:hypothetical protein
MFDAEAAEWQRWYLQLCGFRAQSGHCSPMPLAAGGDFYLLNWCSVQVGGRGAVGAGGRGRAGAVWADSLRGGRCGPCSACPTRTRPGACP